ncbi:MAG TPA: SDR family NAD(P)-dependent oxidoreductase [Sporichthyaceae bacterium]|nr:SDR family NAD(P)-dependent oxidoreductase [Sporichthyaceae bacterium]
MPSRTPAPVGAFTDRTAFVTGAGSGIGAAVALALAEAGAAVALADLDPSGLEAIAARIRAVGGRALPLIVDVAEPSRVEEAMDATLAEFGALHLAVNSAGVGGPPVLIGDYDIKDWQRIIDINLTGVFNCLRREIPPMVAGGGGSIVNISSLAGTRGCPMMSAYVAAKHGVLGLTKTAALEYAAAGVRVNAVAPGPVDTPLLADMDPATRAAWEGGHPLGRMANTADVTAACLFLLSGRASMITGVHHAVDGGLGIA